MIVVSAKFKEMQELPKQILQILPSGDFFEIDELFSIPNIEECRGIIIEACNLINRLYNIEKEKKGLIVVIGCSVSGSSKSISISDNTLGYECLEVVFLDIRMILECYAILLASPISTLSDDVSLPMAIFRLAQAGRVAGYEVSGCQRISRGLLVDAINLMSKTNQIFPDIRSLESKSELSDYDKILLFRTLVLFVFFHEYGHSHLQFFPEREEKELEITKVMLETYQIDDEHRSWHDKEESEFQNRLFGEDRQHASSEIVLKELKRFLVGEASRIAKVDHEEVVCDRIAAQHTAMANALSGGMGPYEVSLSRCAVAFILAYRHYITFGKSGYEVVGAYLDGHMVRSQLSELERKSQFDSALNEWIQLFKNLAFSSNFFFARRRSAISFFDTMAFGHFSTNELKPLANEGLIQNLLRSGVVWKDNFESLRFAFGES